MKKNLLVIGICLILGGGGYVYYSLLHESRISTLEALSRTAPDGFSEYRNDRYHISLFHANGAAVEEHQEGYGAMTITVENTAKVRGYQIFVVPYGETTITEERFLADIPSGVRTDVQQESIDGIEAVSFYSQDLELGDTFEFWFIRGGYLYEVTTLKGLEPWFRERLATWKFI
ncbi:hypothetical protein GW943_01355 [Candidatus Parcubacteria bacterium]|uniref:DUF4367 domain-containing protein n=1 Tax=Candidatus Kaiserbacteria bacterium CG10_big_fil_rev_8_21_14_0_10_47_16 TaxID=1974608 RepID=A0A2H0UE38_9BACT|nr:hypothetical protein [Candidatus Parcubacteria bacterium]PIR84684.1 MAG: hypothetical protein COU16_00655 [Candidatus Kaiserbacteria bacterium CG10_big_fil_rev_8_21_14_0_10_47_16]